MVIAQSKQESKKRCKCKGDKILAFAGLSGFITVGLGAFAGSVVYLIFYLKRYHRYSKQVCNTKRGIPLRC